jgi:prevent-host-death family protein
MKQDVQIAQLKARLSAYLREVRKGGELVVMDRKTPVARVLPYEQGPHRLERRPPLPNATHLRDLALPPFPVVVADATRFLREDREGAR